MEIAYPSSIATANKILNAYENVRWAILASPMQAGKSGSYIYLAEQMLERGMISSVFVISGISDNALRDQTYERIQHVGKVYFLYSIGQKAQGNRIAALKEFSSSLIIIDESHIGADMGSTLSTFLQLLGIGGNGEVDESLYPNEGADGQMSARVPYILSVSATAYAEINVADRKMIVVHEPGPGYVGLADLNIINIENPLKPEEQLLPALRALRSTRTYAIVRSLPPAKYRLPSGEMVVIPYDSNRAREMIQREGFKIIYADMDNETNLPPILSKEPAEFTVILIKKYARAGQTFPKKYISLVWEIFSKSDEQAQGLPGRCCGYEESAKRVQVFGKKALLDAHIEWQVSGYTPQTIPSSGKNISLSDHVGERAGNIIPQYQKIGIYDSIEEVEDHYQEYGYVTMPQFGVHVGNRTWTQEEIIDEMGRTKQWLPIPGDGDRVQAWSLDYMVEFLTKISPLIGATNTLEGGKRAQVAKVAYRNLEDNTSKVYVLYFYDGPLSTDKIVTLERSMYVHGTDQSRLMGRGNAGEVGQSIANIRGVINHISINPSDISTAEGLERTTKNLMSQIYAPASLIITATGVESEAEIENIMQMVKDITLRELTWRAYVSPALGALRPFLVERRNLDVPLYTPSNQADTARFLISIFAPDRDNMITGAELERQNAVKYLWPYTRSLSTYLTSTSFLPGIGKERRGGINYYYALEPNPE